MCIRMYVACVFHCGYEDNLGLALSAFTIQGICGSTAISKSLFSLIETLDSSTHEMPCKIRLFSTLQMLEFNVHLHLNHYNIIHLSNQLVTFTPICPRRRNCASQTHSYSCKYLLCAKSTMLFNVMETCNTHKCFV